MIEHGVNGALLPVRDLGLLPDAIEEMLELGADERAKFGRAARAKVLEAHTLKGEREAYQRIYAEAMADFDAPST